MSLTEVAHTVGFLERAIPVSGSPYKATEEGLRRKPILFVFGTEFAPAFIAANKRARAARGSDLRARRPIGPANGARLPAGFSVAHRTNSPKNKSEAERRVIMGKIREAALEPTQNLTPLPRLSDTALRVFGKPRRF